MKIDYSKYYTYKEMEDVIKYLAEEYPSSARLSTLGVTDEGRNIYLLAITKDINSDDAEKKPGYYVQASLHSSEPSGFNACLHMAETLLKDQPEVMNDVIFYIVPRINPDGIEGNLVNNTTTRSKNIKDPKKRENIINCMDMDGDGLILQMRVKNPLGNYKEVEPGIMAPRQQGETEGIFYDLYEEGEVENYNGTPPDYSHRMYDFNRCYPINWIPNVSSSEYPGRFTESRVVMEFLVTHPNIFAGMDYHNGPNGILRSPMCDDHLIDHRNLKLIKSIGEKAAEITGFPLIHEYNYGKRKFVRHGNTNDFAYGVLGISHYVVELGSGINDIGVTTDEYLTAGKQDWEYYSEIKKFNEEKGNNPVFYEFKPFKHPQLGDVEIGGKRSGSGYLQNPVVLPEIVSKTTEFMLLHADMRPKLLIGDVETLELGDGIKRIRAQIKNLGIMGTQIIKNDSYNSKIPVNVYIEGDCEILSRPNIYEKDNLDSMENMYVEWFIKTKDNSTLYIVAEHPKVNVTKQKV